MPVRRALAAVALLMLALVGLPVATASAAEFEVGVVDFAFIPQEQFVNAGDTVTWVWAEENVAEHNVVPVEEGAFEPSPLQSEGTHPVTFEEAGSYPYFCTIHSSPTGTEEGDMNGVVEVLPAGEPLPEPGPEPRPAPEPGALPQAENNVAAALAWSSLFADGSAPDVLLGRDDDFADALSSGGVQGLLDAPLLLTPTGSLHPDVEAELARLGAERVTILGGVNAVGPEVENRLRELGYEVIRIEGETRLETATGIAGALFPSADTAILARAFASPDATDPTQAFADSLAAGGAAAHAGFTILLSETAQLSQATRAYLQSSMIRTVFVIGGAAALSTQVEEDLTALGIEVIRVEGPTRFHTAVQTAFTFYQARPTVTLLVEGQAANAWAAGFTAASAAESAPILLSNGDVLPQPTLQEISFGIPPLCGPYTSPVACGHAQTAAGSGQFGDPGMLLTALNGANEVPGPGAPAGVSGDAAIFATPDPGALCFELAAYGLTEPVQAAHIHQGTPDEAGAVVVPLVPPIPDEQSPSSFIRSCVFDLDPGLVSDIFANPGGYYVNLHTATFPDGAVRGQLLEAEVIGFAELSGANEVPGPGAEQGGGFSAMVTNADDHSQLCYFIAYGLPEAATAAHIHAGGPDVAGDVVHPLQLPPATEFEGFFSAEGTFCDTAVDPALVDDLLVAPGDYYVNIHTETFPAGAIRGQLFNPFGGEGPPPEFAGWSGWRNA